MDKILGALEKLLSAIGLASFLGLIAVVSLQIVSRLFLPWVFAWTEELSRFLFIAAVCFVAPPALRRNEFVYVDFLVARIRQKGLVAAVQNLILLAAMALILGGAFTFASLGYANSSPVLKLPMWIAYLMPAISFVGISVFLLEKLLVRPASPLIPE